MSWKKGVYWSLFIIFITACQQESTTNIPDVSDIVVDVNIRRFEQDLFGVSPENTAAGLQFLEGEYPEFSKIYFENIIDSKNPKTAPEGHEAYVKGFLEHPSVQGLYDTTMLMYPDLEDIEQEFEQAFKFYKYYFPERPTPDVTTYIAEFNYAGFIYGENSLAVGLDLFLGEDYPYLQKNPYNSGFSAYLTRSNNKEHLVSKTLQPLIDDMMPPVKGNRMIDHMIHNGKKLYLLDHLMPYVQDSVIMEVSGAQTEWLEENELEMWAYFLQEELLYSSVWQDIRKFVDYSPHSPGMPPEAPGRTANWVGWQIIKKYMERFPETSMQELIALQDAQEILNQSKYRPDRE